MPNEEKQILDILTILPEKLPCGYKILWKELSNNKIDLYVDKSGFEGGSKAKSIKIKRFIPLGDLFFEGMGLWFGDGSKLSEGIQKIFGFTNNQINLHKHFLSFSKQCLGINSEEFKARILIPKELSNNIKEIEKEISNKLHIPISNFNKERIQKVSEPCLEIRICSTLLGLINNILLKKFKNTIYENKFVAGFLRGLIASEGCIHLGIRKRLKMVSIAAKEESERDFIRKLLLSLSIIPNKDGYATVLITGLSNFKIINKWNLCELHPIKNSKFKLGLKLIKKEVFRKVEGKLWILKLLSTQTRTVRELSDLLNRTPGSIRNNHLIGLEKLGLVKRKGRINNCRIWKITKEGLKILQEENPLKKLKHMNLR